MSGSDIAEFCRNAAMQAARELYKLAKTTDEEDLELRPLNTKSQVVKLLAEVRRNRNEYEVKDERIEALAEENRALRDALEILKDQRKTDKETISKWQDHVKNLEKELDELRSIEDTPQKQFSQPDDTSVYVEQTQEGELVPSSSVYQSGSKPVDEPENISRNLLSQNLESQQYSLPSDPPTDQNSDLKSSQLANKDWHPADFRLNSNHDVFNIPNDLNFTAKRKCMHGTDCKECEQFYGLLDQQMDYEHKNGAQLSSRHRVDADKQGTPPGYWRTDFSSDNMEEDKKRTAEQALAEGKNRFTEALNNGRYVFKDPKIRDYAKRRLRKS
ncbi:hypothetical protein FF38_04197 [Lucilia cuprina]|uniref:DNA endonuclease activator Ctp1 C-terminal domain-containing protein n=1 Tax=Lucilia cuprina TaxID=7375 RepID=A0A0L0CLW5_LUCCU|nr:hypothetical protein FF38_04197 [Lucilia cuprina]